MYIDEKYELKANGDSVTLIEHYMSNPKEGEPKPKTYSRYFGTVYQALKKYIDLKVAECGSMSEIPASVKAALMEIDSAKDKIKSEFRIEVRVK